MRIGIAFLFLFFIYEKCGHASMGCNTICDKSLPKQVASTQQIKSHCDAMQLETLAFDLGTTEAAMMTAAGTVCMTACVNPEISGVLLACSISATLTEIFDISSLITLGTKGIFKVESEKEAALDISSTAIAGNAKMTQTLFLIAKFGLKRFKPETAAKLSEEQWKTGQRVVACYVGGTYLAMSAVKWANVVLTKKAIDSECKSVNKLYEPSPPTTLLKPRFERNFAVLDEIQFSAAGPELTSVQDSEWRSRFSAAAKTSSIHGRLFAKMPNLGEIPGVMRDRGMSLNRIKRKLTEGVSPASLMIKGIPELPSIFAEEIRNSENLEFFVNGLPPKGVSKEVTLQTQLKTIPSPTLSSSPLLSGSLAPVTDVTPVSIQCDPNDIYHAGCGASIFKVISLRTSSAYIRTLEDRMKLKGKLKREMDSIIVPLEDD